MGTGSLLVMAAILLIVWGGLAVTLTLAWRQERRREPDKNSGAPDTDAA